MWHLAPDLIELLVEESIDRVQGQLRLVGLDLGDLPLEISNPFNLVFGELSYDLMLWPTRKCPVLADLPVPLLVPLLWLMSSSLRLVSFQMRVVTSYEVILEPRPRLPRGEGWDSTERGLITMAGRTIAGGFGP